MNLNLLNVCLLYILRVFLFLYSPDKQSEYSASRSYGENRAVWCVGEVKTCKKSGTVCVGVVLSFAKQICSFCIASRVVLFI